MVVNANATANTLNIVGGNVGIGTTAPTSKLEVLGGRLEVGGTASASYLLTGNTLQVGGFASAAYSRFGTSTLTTNPAGNWITGSNDLLISGDLYGVGSRRLVWRRFNRICRTSIYLQHFICRNRRQDRQRRHRDDGAGAYTPYTVSKSGSQFWRYYCCTTSFVYK
ncbi:MAG: hypothetical protein HYT67_00500 [Candidatus Yanofskybacteria bacterium]|nr:hypothetical protein [Candidatus Yanofskybacteria bacterium]